MTLNDFLKRVNKTDYDKVIIISDRNGWSNISAKVDISESTITLYVDKSTLFRDD